LPRLSPNPLTRPSTSDAAVPEADDRLPSKLAVRYEAIVHIAAINEWLRL
jgi:hypothetical protein